MKHQTTRDFFHYWDAKRGSALAPHRANVDPCDLRGLLADTFVLSANAGAGFPILMAGTRVSALLGEYPKGQALLGRFTPETREMEQLLAAVSEDQVPAVAGISAASSSGRQIPLELLLLPLATRMHEPAALTGSLTTLEGRAHATRELRLVSWRFIRPEARSAARPEPRTTLAGPFALYQAARA